MKDKRSISETEINAFKKEGSTVESSIVKKLFEQNIILWKLMVQSKETLQKGLKSLLEDCCRKKSYQFQIEIKMLQHLAFSMTKL